MAWRSCAQGWPVIYELPAGAVRPLPQQVVSFQALSFAIGLIRCLSCFITSRRPFGLHWHAAVTQERRRLKRPTFADDGIGAVIKGLLRRQRSLTASVIGRCAQCRPTSASRELACYAIALKAPDRNNAAFPPVVWLYRFFAQVYARASKCINGITNRLLHRTTNAIPVRPSPTDSYQIMILYTCVALSSAPVASRVVLGHIAKSPWSRNERPWAGIPAWMRSACRRTEAIMSTSLLVSKRLTCPSM
jgi:hypothetical protein